MYNSFIHIKISLQPYKGERQDEHSKNEKSAKKILKKKII